MMILSNTPNRGRVGALVRLYGYPGQFVIMSESTSDLYQWRVVRNSGPRILEFSILDASIVEVDGHPVPLLSLPIAPPADDYPHGRTQIIPNIADRELPLCRNVEADPRFYVLPLASMAQ